MGLKNRLRGGAPGLLLLLSFFLSWGLSGLRAQEGTASRPAEGKDRVPVLRCGVLPRNLKLDGILDEPAWKKADAIPNLTVVEPNVGAKPTGRTRVQVLADPGGLVIGILCEDPEPDKIVSYSVARDAHVFGEDHVRIVLGTYMDGRTGYVFAVNPSGARFDALVARRGESFDSSWDGIWEAATHRGAYGWSVEIRIPILTLGFKKGLHTWHFNVERRIERIRENSRWAGISRDWRVTQTSHAGLLTNLPDFNLGYGISIRPSGVASYGKKARGRSPDVDTDLSLDVEWRITPDLLGALTFNTDFAETEVDTRRLNLTRFPLFFPEKRTFFLEGRDAFDFGLGLRTDVVPFHSRRIGLVSGHTVPLDYGAKMVGRVGKTSIGALGVRTGREDDVAPATEMGVVRLRRDVLEESSVGMIATAGDPLGRGGSWMAGTDFTYQTSKFQGDKNFLVGVWGLTMDRAGLRGGSKSAFGGKIDYPNDLWDISLDYKRIGKEFDPSLGFVPRKGVQKYHFGCDYMPRPENSFIRQWYFESGIRYYTKLEGKWESYSVFTAPFHFETQEGDEIEFNVMPQGERLDRDFEISDGVVIPKGTYRWVRYRFQVDSASKRPVSVGFAWRFGPFYEGHLDTFEVDLFLRPCSLVTLSFSSENNNARLPQGNFHESVYGSRIRLNLSPDMDFSSYIQYDTESKLLGTNNRFRWTITPYSDAYLVWNYNVDRRDGRFAPESYETVLKLQYTYRF